MESTQTIAFDLATQGVADRTVVVAEHQTAGRGRRGHHWQDEPGAALLCSIVVRSSTGTLANGSTAHTAMP